jgi:hypothetical protein
MAGLANADAKIAAAPTIADFITGFSFGSRPPLRNRISPRSAFLGARCQTGVM